jgi:hypothetical protein
MLCNYKNVDKFLNNFVFIFLLLLLQSLLILLGAHQASYRDKMDLGI